MAEREMEEVITGNIQQFDTAGQFINGTLLEKRVVKGKFGDQQAYDIKCDDDQIRTVFGTAILDDKMRSIALGEYIEVVYKGKIKARNSATEYKDFVVKKEKKAVK
jgi:hypothetical protein